MGRFLYVWLIIMIILQVVGSFLAGATIYHFLLGLLSVAYVFLVTLANRWNFVLGAIMSTCYALIAYESLVYGDMTYQLLTVGINLVGIGLYVGMNKPFKTRMVLFSAREWLGLLTGGLALFLALWVVLAELSDPLPIRDSLVATIGLLALYSLVRGYKYSFALWIVSNSVQIILWLATSAYSDHGLSMALNYTIFLGNSIVGLINWVYMAKKYKEVEE